MAEWRQLCGSDRDGNAVARTGSSNKDWSGPTLKRISLRWATTSKARKRPPGKHPYVDLRVDAHDEPLGELRRLFELYNPVTYYYYGRPGDRQAYGRDEEWLAKQGKASPIIDK